MYIDKTEVTVRYVETDKMGIVHHSKYYPWFEIGRSEFIKATGLSYSDIEDENIMMPLSETYCKYLKPARYEDEIIIETYIKEITPVKIVFEYKIIKKETGELLARGKTKQAFVYADTFRLMNLKKYNEGLWKKFKDLI